MNIEAYAVPKLSNLQIREIAGHVRSVLKLPDGPVMVPRLLDRLSVEYEIPYDLFSDSDLDEADQNVEAFFNPLRRLIFVHERVYAQIEAGSPRGRFTIAHEIGHAVLGHEPVLYRKGPSHTIPYLSNSEGQANLFAAEFLMPVSQILRHQLQTVDDIQQFFGTSHQASTKRMSDLQRDGYIGKEGGMSLKAQRKTPST